MFITVPKTRQGNENYFKAIFLIALPIIIQGLVFQVQTLINRAFLGNLKTEYLSALGNILFPYLASLEVLIAVCTGLTIIIAQKTGARLLDEVTVYFNASLIFNTFLSLGLFFFWNLLSRQIFTLMGVDHNLLDYCFNYVRIISVYLIFFGADITIQAALQGSGVTKPIMYAGIGKVSLNIFFDWIFIFGHFGFPRLGIYGAAIATLISNIISAVLLIIFVGLSNKINLKIVPAMFKQHWDKYREVMKVGLPTGFELFAWHFGNLMLIRLFNRFNQTAVGVYTLIFGIEIVVYMIFNGIGKAALTLVGQEKGAANENNACKILSSCIRYNLVIVGMILLIFLSCPKNILGIFTNNEDIINNSILYFILICIAIIPKSLNVIVGSGIRGLGDTKWMLYTQILGTIFVIVSSYLMVYVFGIDVIAIYITLLVDEVLRATINTTHFFRGRKKVSDHTVRPAV